jgi:hypothetical protein
MKDLKDFRKIFQQKGKYNERFYFKFDETFLKFQKVFQQI